MKRTGIDLDRVNEVYTLYFIVAERLDDERREDLFEQISELVDNGQLNRFQGLELLDAELSGFLQNQLEGLPPVEVLRSGEIESGGLRDLHLLQRRHLRERPGDPFGGPGSGCAPFLSRSSPTDMIYFDHNATTPVRPEVLEAMLPHLGGLAGNPSSLHAAGRRARSGVDEGREKLAAALGCPPGEICFTSGGTESDNWAIKGVVSAAGPAASRRRRIVTSSIEHHAVWHACEHLQELGIEVVYAPVDAEGTVLPEAIEELIDAETLLVSVMHANNETGRLQPVADIAAAAREKGSLFHVDAVQSFGKLPWRAADLGADLISVSAHKINGPKGVGALWVRPGTLLHPLVHGGGHEGGRRAGTENVAGIVGFGAAAALAQEELQGPGETAAARVGRLRDQLEAGILASLKSVEINGRSAAPSAAAGDPGRLPNTCNAAFRGVEAEAVILGLDLEGVAVASGSACTSGAPEPSHVLLAMGLEPRLASSSVRFSLGWGNTEAEVARCLELLPGIVGRLRELSTEPVS